MIQLARTWNDGSTDMVDAFGKHEEMSDQPAEPAASISHLLMEARQSQEGMDALLHAYRAYFQIRLRGDDRIVRFRSKVDGSDILQTALVKAFKDFPAFRGTTEKEFSSWLHKIVNRTVIDAMWQFFGTDRDVNREFPLHALGDSASLVFEVPAADGSGPVSQVVRGEAALQLAAAIERLPPQQAMAMTLRHFQQMPINQIAAEMDKTTTAVAGLLKRGAATLRKHLPHLLK